MSTSQVMDFEVKKPPQSEGAMAVSTPTPMDLLQIAVSQNLDVEKLEKLLALQMQWEANEARKAFVEAMNAFKKNPPTILRNKIADTGKYKYAYATLDVVCAAIISGLSAHGISHRWETSQQDKAIQVTCVLTHERGHSERTTLGAPPDTSGAKNEIQQLGSTVSYLERYTLLAATGIAVSNGDNDGATANIAMPDERFVALQDAIENARDDEELRRIYQNACKEADAAGDQDAKRQFNQSKNKTYRSLHASR